MADWQYYTIELEVSYHGDNSPTVFRLKQFGKDEDYVCGYVLGNLDFHGIPLVNDNNEPIHGVRISYLCESKHDEKYLPEYGRATVILN